MVSSLASRSPSLVLCLLVISFNLNRNTGLCHGDKHAGLFCEKLNSSLSSMSRQCQGNLVLYVGMKLDKFPNVQ